MPKRLLVEGLDWAVTEDQLTRIFAPFGDLDETKIALDWETGRSRGFGYVTFRDSADAEAAIAGLDGQRLSGKTLRVMIAPELGLRTHYRGGDYGAVEAPTKRPATFRSADFDGGARGGPDAPRTDRKFYRSADFGYVEPSAPAKPQAPNPPQPPVPPKAGDAAARAARERGATNPEDSLEDEERVNRAKFGGWSRGSDNDGGVGGGGDTFG